MQRGGRCLHSPRQPNAAQSQSLGVHGQTHRRRLDLHLACVQNAQGLQISQGIQSNTLAQRTQGLLGRSTRGFTVHDVCYPLAFLLTAQPTAGGKALRNLDLHRAHWTGGERGGGGAGGKAFDFQKKRRATGLWNLRLQQPGGGGTALLLSFWWIST